MLLFKFVKEKKIRNNASIVGQSACADSGIKLVTETFTNCPNTILIHTDTKQIIQSNC